MNQKKKREPKDNNFFVDQWYIEYLVCMCALSNGQYIGLVGFVSIYNIYSFGTSEHLFLKTKIFTSFPDISRVGSNIFKKGC